MGKKVVCSIVLFAAMTKLFSQGMVSCLQKACLTQRAPDLGYAPRFLSFFLARAGFRFEGDSTLPPQAGNASRWAAAQQMSFEYIPFGSTVR